MITKELLTTLQSGESLDRDTMRTALTEIMEGQWEDPQIAAFLMGLSSRGETIDELTGAALVMREKALPINAPEEAVDCCGTGGDASGTYNISTAVAITAAACGICVAKHGNRSASSKSGAADVLEALGINLNVTQDKLEEALRLYNFAFLMAPRHHAAMKYVVPVRQSLGIRTIFNLLGPLANPANTKRQLLGVFDHKWVLPMAETLKNLGTTSAWVVHGEDGLDEITVTGKTHIAQLKDGKITETTLTPEDFGLNQHRPEDLKGGQPEQNAAALLEILSGAHNAYRDIVLANVAALLSITGKEENLKAAVHYAADTIDTGKALELLQRYKDFTQKHGQEAA